MFFRNSKPLVGFDDRFLVVSGILINTHIAVTSFYQGAIYKVPFVQYFPKWLEYFFFIGFMWLVIRGLLLIHRKRNPDAKDRKKRYLFLPFLVIPYVLIAVLYIKYLQPLLNIQMPGYRHPELKELLITGTFITIIDLAVYIILMYIYQLNKAQVLEERLKKENALIKLKALKNQLSPHFLSNGLTTLLFLIDSDAEKSKDFVHRLSSLYNRLLEFSERDLITIQEEIQYLEDYIDLLHSRFGKNLTIAMDLPSSLNSKKIVPLSTQVGIENAVKHNIVSTLKPLQISIRANDQYIVIENNYQPKEQIPDRRGIGISNIRKRYELLTEKELLIKKDTNKFILKIPIIGD